MDISSQEEGEKKKVTEIKTFSVPYPLKENQGNLTINTNTPSKPSKEQLIKQAFKFHSQGNIPEASKYYVYFINQGFKDHRVFSNYGTILRVLGKLQDAELSTRKAIEINPNFAEAMATDSRFSLLLIRMIRLIRANAGIFLITLLSRRIYF